MDIEAGQIQVKESKSLDELHEIVLELKRVSKIALARAQARSPEWVFFDRIDAASGEYLDSRYAAEDEIPW